MLLMEFSMFPVGTGESLSSYVAKVVQIVDQSGLDYLLNPMGTVVEGEPEAVLALLGQCLAAMSEDCNRISCSVKLDYRRGRSGRLKTKIKSVEAKVGHALKTSC